MQLDFFETLAEGLNYRRFASLEGLNYRRFASLTRRLRIIGRFHRPWQIFQPLMIANPA